MVETGSLPVQQETLEFGDGYRLDLRAQTVDRKPMDAGQEPAVTPFDRLRLGCREVEVSASHFSARFNRRVFMSISICSLGQLGAVAEFATKNETLALKCEQSRFDFGFGQSQQIREPSRGYRAADLHASTD